MRWPIPAALRISGVAFTAPRRFVGLIRRSSIARNDLESSGLTAPLPTAVSLIAIRDSFELRRGIILTYAWIVPSGTSEAHACGATW